MHTFTKYTTTQNKHTKKLKPGLVAYYILQTENGTGQFLRK